MWACGNDVARCATSGGCTMTCTPLSPASRTTASSSPARASATLQRPEGIGMPLRGPAEEAALSGAAASAATATSALAPSMAERRDRAAAGALPLLVALLALLPATMEGLLPSCTCMKAFEAGATSGTSARDGAGDVRPPLPLLLLLPLLPATAPKVRLLVASVPSTSITSPDTWLTRAERLRSLALRSSLRTALLLLAFPPEDVTPLATPLPLLLLPPPLPLAPAPTAVAAVVAATVVAAATAAFVATAATVAEAVAGLVAAADVVGLPAAAEELWPRPVDPEGWEGLPDAEEAGCSKELRSGAGTGRGKGKPPLGAAATAAVGAAPCTARSLSTVPLPSRLIALPLMLPLARAPAGSQAEAACGCATEAAPKALLVAVLRAVEEAAGRASAVSSCLSSSCRRLPCARTTHMCGASIRAKQLKNGQVRRGKGGRESNGQSAEALLVCRR